ncbi:alpha/beta hydrolase [Neptunicoccus cionae]|uniref:alpha/beta hydrolase n=1 Tax=Neptunicoccus cionae TaxID=2035344 RepID=UPI00257069A3|nr:alpha/beta hydrolase [Amylibacter cionae]
MNYSSLMVDAPFFPQVAEGPASVDAYWVKTEDDVRLRVARWHGESSPKGTVFVFQGRTENIEKYGRTAEALHNSGYVVFAIDWRGQGLSDRLTDNPMTGHIGQFSDYQKDVAAMIKAAEALDLPKPWYLIGHSLGACVGLRAIIDGLPVSACAFTAPLWGVNLSTIQRLAAWPLSWAAQFVGKGHSYAPGTRGESYVLQTAFEDNRLTHDPEMYQYYVNISEQLVDQQIGGPSMGWLFQTLKETRSLSKMPSPDTPCITFCGVEDSIVAISAAQDRMARWPQGKLELVENARHDVLCEVPSIRNEVLARISELFSST